jgi:hypothetical protein
LLRSRVNAATSPLAYSTLEPDAGTAFRIGINEHHAASF